MTVSAATLALEQLMLHPGFADAVKAVCANTPVHQRDQADAAIGDATEVLLGVNRLVSDEPARLAQPSDIPGWLRLTALGLFVAYIGGTADTCRHSPHAGRPEPVFAAVWRPGLIACGACLRLFGAASGSTADSRCDACSRVCAGPEYGDPINPSMIQVGPLVVMFGTCRGCTLTPAGDPIPDQAPAPRTRPRGGRGHGRGRGR